MASGRFNGPPRPGLMLAMVAVGAIFAYWAYDAPRGARMSDAPSLAKSDAGASRAWGASVGFESARRLEEHYEKHGAEFGRITRQDYLRQAQHLRDAAAGGPVLESVRRDGVATRFDRDTGAFIAFNPDGTIRTFFKPNDGERYFRRQAERSGE
jgi:pyocin large subunit-like protein